MRGISSVIGGVMFIAVFVLSLYFLQLYGFKLISVTGEVVREAAVEAIPPVMRLSVSGDCGSGFIDASLRVVLPGDRKPLRLVVAYSSGVVESYDFSLDASVAFRLNCSDKAMLIVEDETGWGWSYRFDYDPWLRGCLEGAVVEPRSVLECNSMLLLPGSTGSSAASILGSIFAPSLVPVIVAGPALKLNPSGVPLAVYEGLKPDINIRVEVHRDLYEDFTVASRPLKRAAQSVTVDQYLYSYKVNLVGDDDVLFSRLRLYRIHGSWYYDWTPYFVFDPPILAVEHASAEPLSLTSNVTGYLLIPFLVARNSRAHYLELLVAPTNINATDMTITEIYCRSFLAGYKCRIVDTDEVALGFTAPQQYFSVKLALLDPRVYDYRRVVVETTRDLPLDWRNRVAVPLKLYTLVSPRSLDRVYDIIVRIDPSRIFSDLGPGYDVVVAALVIYFGASGYVELPRLASYTTWYWDYTVKNIHVFLLNGVDMAIAIYRDGVATRLSENTVYITPPRVNAPYKCRAETVFTKSQSFRITSVFLNQWATIVNIRLKALEQTMILGYFTNVTSLDIEIVPKMATSSTCILDENGLRTPITEYLYNTYTVKNVPDIIQLWRTSSNKTVFVLIDS